MNAQKLQAAKDLIASGDKIKAQAVLAGVVTETPHDAEAWYLLSESIDDRERKLIYLRRALQLNPTLDEAAAQLAHLEAIEEEEDDALKTLFSPVPEEAEVAAEVDEAPLDFEELEELEELEEDSFADIFEEVEEDEVDTFSFEDLGIDEEEVEALEESDIETIFTLDDDAVNLDEEDEFDLDELAPDVVEQAQVPEDNDGVEADITAVAASAPTASQADEKEGDSTNLLVAILGALALILAYFFIQSLFALF